MILAQYRVELRRLFHRRALEVLVVLAVCALTVVGVSMFLSTGPEQRPVYFEDTGGGFAYVAQTFCPSTLVTSGAAQQASVPLETGTDCPRTTSNAVPRSIGNFGNPDPCSPWNGSIAYFSVGLLLVLWVLAASLAACSP